MLDDMPLHVAYNLLRGKETVEMHCYGEILNHFYLRSYVLAIQSEITFKETWSVTMNIFAKKNIFLLNHL